MQAGQGSQQSVGRSCKPPRSPDFLLQGEMFARPMTPSYFVFSVTVVGLGC